MTILWIYFMLVQCGVTGIFYGSENYSGGKCRMLAFSTIRAKLPAIVLGILRAAPVIQKDYFKRHYLLAMIFFAELSDGWFWNHHHLYVKCYARCQVLWIGLGRKKLWSRSSGVRDKISDVWQASERLSNVPEEHVVLLDFESGKFGCSQPPLPYPRLCLCLCLLLSLAIWLMWCEQGRLM